MNSIYSVVLLGACLAAATSASAAVPPQAQPSSATAEVPYRSAFADYRPFREEPVTDWRASNGDVARGGGHVGLMRGTNAAARDQRTHEALGESGRSAKAPAADAHRH